jgi:hypothetical protein
MATCLYGSRDKVVRVDMGPATRADYKAASADQRKFKFKTPMPTKRGFRNTSHMAHDGTTTSWPVGAIPVRS